MQFVKFNSIENLETARRTNSLVYQRAKDIPYWVVTEKIDGANIGLYFTPEGEFGIARRNDLLGNGASFYDVFNQVNTQLGDFVKAFKDYVRDLPDVKQVILYGEYFGSRVMNRLYYGCKYGFRFFGMSSINQHGEICHESFFDFTVHMADAGLEEYIVPVLGVYEKFDEACAHANNAVTTLFSDEKHKDIMEGVVIQPYYGQPVSDFGNFRFKNKNEEFSEKSSTKAERVADTEDVKALKAMRENFKTYCGENRMYAVISKLGMPTSPKDTAKYLGAFVQDAWEDFVKDNPEVEGVSAGERKFISNIGSEGYLLFKEVQAKLLQEA